MAHAAGALVVSDEVMCGLARHGQGDGKCFLSDAWGLQPDCITFGKAVATGMFPLAGRVAPPPARRLVVHRAVLFRLNCRSPHEHEGATFPPTAPLTPPLAAGAIITHGLAEMHSAGRSVSQSHTYAASSPRALMAATAVLNSLPQFAPQVAAAGDLLGAQLQEVRRRLPERGAVEGCGRRGERLEGEAGRVKVMQGAAGVVEVVVMVDGWIGLLGM